MKGYLNLRKQALDILKSELPTDLYYHDVHHTLDVLSVVNQYIRKKKLDTTSKYLLKIAGLLHDIGYTVGRFNHEEKSAGF